MTVFWSGGVAQLGERLLCKQEVIGSKPFTSTTGETKGFAESPAGASRTAAKPAVSPRRQANGEREAHRTRYAARRTEIATGVPKGIAGGNC